MLVSLTIKNIVLIAHLTMSFEQGFSALTGETGAGKSILLDSLGLALGARADSGLVRKGQDQAQVTATFAVPDTHPVYELLAGAEITAERGEDLVLRRQLGADGRSRAFINDQPVSAGLLRQAGALLVEIHGQFDTQGLLDPRTHLTLLDEYAGIDRAALAARWQDWQAAQKILDEERRMIEQARADEAYLQQALNDLDALDAQAGEEEKLSALRERLMRREQIIEALRAADQGVAEIENVMTGIWRALERLGEEGAPVLTALERMQAELQESGAAIATLSADMDETEYSLQEIDDRLFALRGQARKHGCMVDELPEKRDELAAQLSLITAQDDRLATLARQVAAARADFIACAERAGTQRRKAAQKLDKLMAAELPPLKLDKARFVTTVSALDESGWGPHGQERAAFEVSTNPGAAPGPLHKIASGGEMARFMLALKVVLAEIGVAGTLIFDEVDSGIGGGTAAAVGERLARLAQHKDTQKEPKATTQTAGRQILVVTHSPQVASRAAHHWIVAKSGEKELQTDIMKLQDPAARREEIARMLSGSKISAEARAAAGKLLEATG